MAQLKPKIKCPKCKNGKKLTLIEVWTGHTITWETEEGKFDRSDGALEHGDACKVHARCPCGHGWTIRGALQIDDITE